MFLFNRTDSQLDPYSIDDVDFGPFPENLLAHFFSCINHIKSTCIMYCFFYGPKIVFLFKLNLSYNMS